MASLPIRLHPLAADEAEVARSWYFERNGDAASEFLAELNAAMTAISEAPGRWPRLDIRYRRFLLRHFPFSVVYLPLADRVEVIAIAHHRRRPGYWRDRS